MSTTGTETKTEKKKSWLNDNGTFNDTYTFDPSKYAEEGYYDATQYAADYANDRNTYLQEQNLIANKNNAITAAKDTEANKVQYADTRRQLMEKYIPETLLAQGIANTGYTADDFLNDLFTY